MDRNAIKISISGTGILLMMMSANAIADERYAEPKFRDLTGDETAWIKSQDYVRQFNCNSFKINQNIKKLEGSSVKSEPPAFSQRPLFPEGQMECSIYPDYDNEGVVEIVARENGKIDGVQYRVSHTGKDVIGSVGNPFGWEFSCEAGRSGHVCFVEGNGDRFYLQYTSQIEKANIPSGYLISMGKNSVFQIVNLSIDGKDIKPNNTYSIIYGKQASEFISQIKEKSVVMVSYNTPSNRQGEYKIEGEDMQIMRASIPLIKRAFELYNE